MFRHGHKERLLIGTWISSDFSECDVWYQHFIIHVVALLNTEFTDSLNPQTYIKRHSGHVIMLFSESLQDSHYRDFLHFTQINPDWNYQYLLYVKQLHDNRTMVKFFDCFLHCLIKRQQKLDTLASLELYICSTLAKSCKLFSRVLNSILSSCNCIEFCMHFLFILDVGVYVHCAKTYW